MSAKGQQKCFNATVLGTSSGERGRCSIGRKERWKMRGKAARETAFLVEIERQSWRSHG